MWPRFDHRVGDAAADRCATNCRVAKKYHAPCLCAVRGFDGLEASRIVESETRSHTDRTSLLRHVVCCTSQAEQKLSPREGRLSAWSPRSSSRRVRHQDEDSKLNKAYRAIELMFRGEVDLTMPFGISPNMTCLCISLIELCIRACPAADLQRKEGLENPVSG